MSSAERGARERGGAPVRLGEILPGALERIGPTGLWKETRLRRVWREAVGEEVAAHARVGRLRGTTLEVWVSSEVWTTELRYLGPTIVGRLNDTLGGKLVEDLAVRRERKRAL